MQDMTGSTVTIPLSYMHFCSSPRAPDLWTFVHCVSLYITTKFRSFVSLFVCLAI